MSQNVHLIIKVFTISFMFKDPLLGFGLLVEECFRKSETCAFVFLWKFTVACNNNVYINAFYTIYTDE